MGFVVSDRWKGENVSTAEVADILTLINCIKEATVYGVRVPGDLHGSSLCSFATSREVCEQRQLEQLKRL